MAERRRTGDELKARLRERAVDLCMDLLDLILTLPFTLWERFRARTR